MPVMGYELYSIILPTYNERENLPLILWMINKYLSELENILYEVIIVEDNSPDGTFQVAKQMQELYGESKIKILRRSGKLGLGSAYVEGLKLANGKFVFLMDADLSHHPKYMVKFIEKQRENDDDIISSTRYALGGGVAGWDFKRILTSRGANLLASLLLNPSFSDLTGSYRLYKKEILERLMNEVKGRAYVFQMEVLVRAEKLGYSISEIPIIFVDRIYGQSKLGVNEIISYIKGTWTLCCEL